MADTQSSSSEDVTMQVPHIEFFKTLINVFKENRELLSNLPEVMECLLDNSPAKLVEVHQFEEYRYENLAIIVSCWQCFEQHASKRTSAWTEWHGEGTKLLIYRLKEELCQKKDKTKTEMKWNSPTSILTRSPPPPPLPRDAYTLTYNKPWSFDHHVLKNVPFFSLYFIVYHYFIK